MTDKLDSAYSFIKDITKGTEFDVLSERALSFLWKGFSELQCASFMCPCDECGVRFLAWLKSGNDEDAWS